MLTQRKPEATLEEVRSYWSKKNIPQQWYSNKEPFSLQWFNDVSYKRYTLYYSYLREDAEFDAHAGEKILEIGVGLGTDLAEFARFGAKVSGVDLGADQVELTQLNFDTRGLSFESIQQASAESLPFADRSFDVAYSFGVLHHTPDTAKAVSEVHRVLKDDGHAIIMLYARGWKHYLKRCFIHGILLGKLIKNGFSWQGVYNEVSEVHGFSPKTDVYTRRMVRELFHEFSHVEIRKRRLGEFFEYPPYRSRVLPAFFKNFLYLLNAEAIIGENFLIKAYKAVPPQRKGVLTVLFRHY